MNLIQLKVFAAVMEERSFSRAAETLHLSQPTVSAHIRALEQELQVKLFQRGGRDIQVLQAAQLLYPQARKMLQTEQEIQGLFGGEKLHSRRLRIGVSSIPGQYVLPGVMKDFADRYPRVQMAITQTDSRGVLNGIQSGIYDLGLVGTMLPGNGLEFRPFYQDDLVIITPDTGEYRKYRQDTLDISVIQRAPLILREEGSGTRAEAEQYLRAAGILPEELHVAAVMDNPENIKRAVENGLGISFISRLAAEDYVKSGKLRLYRLKDISMKRRLYIVRNRNTVQTGEAGYLAKLVCRFDR